MDNLQARINEAVAYIRQTSPFAPSIAIVLGSGLGDFADQFVSPIVIPYKDIPGFPLPTVEGHTGELVMGSIKGTRVAILRGRTHYYEGLSQQEITIPVRVLRRLGAKTLVLTNAAGGINSSFSPGTVMLINDHINFSGSNPLIGPNMHEFGVRFPDMTDIYTAEHRQKLKEAASKENIPLAEGVYAMYSGPSYETPAEIRFFRTMGADAVGMSTVPEAIVARHSGMKVVGLSTVTNMAAGLSFGELNHAEVVREAALVKEKMGRLLQLAVELFG